MSERVSVNLTAVVRDALRHPRQVYVLKGGLVVCFDTEGSSSVGEAALVLELSRVGVPPSDVEVDVFRKVLAQLGYDDKAIVAEWLLAPGFFHTVRLVWAGSVLGTADLGN